jgi:poly-gamma-glutamate synthesis protein (capsule biosynthesis protein)
VSEKTYAFRAPPGLIETRRLAGFDVVALANNHALDFGVVGLEDTRTALASVGVGWFGAGVTEVEAWRPLILERGGATVALLWFSEVADSNFATSGQAGVARAELDSIREAVSEAQERVDYVVVVMHLGGEYVSLPTEAQHPLARAAIEAGTAAVVGSHAHVLQPWERYGGGVIVYELGNFVFDLDRENLEVLGEGPFATAVLVLELSEGAEPSVEFRPAYIDAEESRPRPASAAEEERVL